jgi:hypothetical protein
MSRPPLARRRSARNLTPTRPFSLTNRRPSANGLILVAENIGAHGFSRPMIASLINMPERMPPVISHFLKPVATYTRSDRGVTLPM